MHKLLLADDEAVIRQCFGDMFAEAGYDVRTVASGEEAVEAFAEFKPDVVVLDVIMPGMNGLTACRRIRASEALTPVIFLTSCEDEFIEEQGMNIGADDYVFKTAPRSLILARVRRAVERMRNLAIGESADAEARTIAVGCAAIDPAELVATFPDGSQEKLTLTETAIIRILASNRKKHFSCREIYRRLGYSGEDVTLRSQISRLKAKLGQAGEAIVSTRGLGYKITG